MAKTLFDHLTAIYQNQKVTYYNDLSESDRKSYSTYIINRFIFMNPEYLPVVNEFQMRHEYVTPRSSYLFYSQALPKGKQFYKYVKSRTKEKYDPDVVEMVATRYMVSSDQAKEYIDIYHQSDDTLDALRDLLRGYGWDEKQIKKSIRGNT